MIYRRHGAASRRFFGTVGQSWMNLHDQYNLESAEIELARRIEREVTPLKDAA
jgi:plasmid maintenance system antidote protein VapI